MTIKRSPAATVFHERAREYDSWFEDSLLFDIELAAVRRALDGCPAPRLEIGCGPGRFARALDVQFGIDPAEAALHLASRRGILTAAGIGEQLPVRSASMATVLVLFTLCFVQDRQQVLSECYRVLRPGGRLVLGIIPAGSPWGKLLADKGAQGHPYYQYARFLELDEVDTLLRDTGFTPAGTISTLFQRPEHLEQLEKPRSGADRRAGFCVITACRTSHQPS
ncbi:class I SAM-dependent methyltransferase [Desulfolithobacter sp.]